MPNDGPDRKRGKGPIDVVAKRNAALRDRPAPTLISWPVLSETSTEYGMKPRRPVVSPEDQALFLEAIGDVRPLPGRDRVAVPPAPASSVRVVEAPPPVALAVEGDAQRYTARGPGVSRSQTADLRAGKIPVDETLDLHGDTIERGLARLRETLAAVSRRGRRCLLVIHGKGTHSEHGAPLREAVLHELLGPLSGYVHAAATAAPTDGGDGATYVVTRADAWSTLKAKRP